MALGNKNNSNSDLIILKLKTKDAEKRNVHPYFEVLRKKDGEFVCSDDERVNSVQGDIVKVDVETKEWEGKEYLVARVFLADEAENELYCLDLRFNNLTRGLFNSLVNLKQFKNISISLYEVDGKNKKTYPAASVWDNSGEEGVMVRWKFEKEDLPEVDLVKNKKGDVVSIDTEELDEFFYDNLEKLGLKIAKKNKKAKEESEGKKSERPSREDLKEKKGGKKEREKKEEPEEEHEEETEDEQEDNYGGSEEEEEYYDDDIPF